MKKLLLLIFLLVIEQTNAQIHSLKQVKFNPGTNKSYLTADSYQKTQSTNGLLDSTKHWTWDTLSLIWKVSDKSINYTYNLQDQNTGNLGMVWNGTGWINQSMTVIT